MAKIVYIECTAGISGDMILGALIDAGLPVDYLRDELSALGLDGWSISAERTHRKHIGATGFTVNAPEDSPARHWSEIRSILEKSSLRTCVKKRAISAFSRLAKCEAEIHGVSEEDVHFHELSGIDSIVDIVGACIGMEWLGASRIVASAVNVGGGMVECRHGRLPVPAPATTALLKGVPFFSQFDGELTTPTGALLLTEFAHEFGSLPLMKTTAVGYGAGGADFHTHANILRIFIGEATADSGIKTEPVVHVQTNIDDMNPQVYPYIIERLLESGALDAYFQQAVMKKGRPAVIFNFLCRPEDLDALFKIVIAESTTLGARILRSERLCIDRKIESVDTEYGAIRIKIGVMGGIVANVMPEYEDCADAARKNAVPILRVMDRARDAAEIKWKIGSPVNA